MTEIGSHEWVEHQVVVYQELRSAYVELAAALEGLLHDATGRHAPLAIVQTRTKQIPSFTEKCLRKAHKYQMPAHQLTDLAGARVITRTSSEAEAVCRYLRDHLDVDWENSDDTRERLQWSEFGYRSIHYVVSLRGDASAGDSRAHGFTCEDDTCPGKGSFHPLKGEIQVRTLAEHAWADIAHDLTYKSGFELPATWRREIALMAAELEGVDRSVERLEEGLRAYAANYGSYLTPEELAAELDVLGTVLEFDPENAVLAHRLAKLAMTAGDWNRAITVLDVFVDDEHPEQTHQPLLRDLGVSLGKRRTRDDLPRGRRYLEAAIELEPTDTDAIASLAGTWAGEDDGRARALYRQAFETDPSDYYPLLNFVDLEIERTGTTEILQILGPLAAASMERCRQHVAVGLNAPWARYSMARFHLLLGEPYEALEHYTLGIRTSLFAVPSLEWLTSVSGQIEGFEWVRRLLLLARAIRFGDTDALEELRGLAPPGSAPIRGPVLIVAGGTDPRLDEQLRSYGPVIHEMLAGFHGTVISGGTRQGICGIVGEAGPRAGGRLHTIGYLPEHLPDDAEPDTRYHEIRHTDGTGFTPLEPLQNWVDLVASGIDPADVSVIGVNGGRIAAVEYRVALALGARVGVITGSGREAARLLADDDWADVGPPVALPSDPETLRAFVTPIPPWSDASSRMSMAQELHRIYREDLARQQRHSDPALADWEELPSTLRASNLAQVDAIITKLRRIGYDVRPASGGTTAFALSDEEVELLAEMEHGRWNAERLSSGWTWGPERDPLAKVSPHLVPWAALPEEIREYDRVFVRDISDVLASAGFEAVRDGAGGNTDG